MKDTPPPNPKKEDGHTGTKVQIIIFGLLLFCLIFFDAFAPIGNSQLIPLSLTGVIAGLTYENFRLNKKWIDFLLMLVGSLILGFFFSMFPSKSHSYNFVKHMQAWPYMFILFFIIFSVAFHKTKLIPWLSEKITLIQSIAFIYWVATHHFFIGRNPVLIFLTTIGTGLCIFSFIHAFTYYHLSDKARLLLSVWSSMVMMLFAVNNIYGVYTSDAIESLSDFWEKVYEWFAYFLLGISSIYMSMNLLMLAGFLPAKGEFFNKAYFRRVKRVKKQHMNRYSGQQTKKAHSIFWLVFAGTIFTANYCLDYLPAHTAIWMVFVSTVMFDTDRGLEKRVE